MYLALAERRGIPWDKLRGSLQNDITLEEVVRSGPEYIPPKDCFRILGQWLRWQNLTGWRELN